MEYKVKFKPGAIKKLSQLEQMEVELEGGQGTALSHWDENKFDKELMTGIKDQGEHVLPVTIDVMELLGHSVSETLATKRPLDELLQEVAGMVFSRQDEIRTIDLEHFEKTELFETIPHQSLEISDSDDQADGK